jgi:hypothetical protein
MAFSCTEKIFRAIVLANLKYCAEKAGKENQKIVLKKAAGRFPAALLFK